MTIKADIDRLVRPCAVCGRGGTAEVWAAFGNQPLANALRPADSAPLPRYDLTATRCSACGHAQLRYVVPPAERYQDYPFRSGLSATFRAHLDDVVRACRRWVPRVNGEDDTGAVLDIGANDGTLLTAFHRAGMPPMVMVGIDADPVASEYPGQCIRGLFPKAALPHRRYSIITTLNTLNAVADLHSFVQGIARCLAPGGIWCVEVPYLGDLLATLSFDTIYHEHVNYFLAAPFAQLVREHDLEVLACDRVPIHGGSLRFIVGRAKDFPGSVGTGPWVYFEERSGLLSRRGFGAFQLRVDRAAQEFADLRARMRGTWAGYGAAAKSTVVCGVFGLGPGELSYIVDETPAKAGKVSPYDIPIVDAAHFRHQPASALLCFAWNYADELERKLRGWGYPTPLVLPVTPERMAHAA